MYKVHLQNFGYSKGPFESFDMALKEAKKTGFETVILVGEPGEIVASYSPVKGLKKYF